MTRFDITGALPTGRTVLQASAGTGKTYSITALIARFIAEQGTPVEQFLVVTFTRAAANELRERTRASLSLAAATLAGGHAAIAATEEHEWLNTVCGTAAAPITDDERHLRLRRLHDAITRFDELTITTIHGFCQQALGQLGLRSGANPDAVLVENTLDIVKQVCRDALIESLAADPTALSPPATDVLTPAQVETLLVDTVTAVLANPGSRLIPANSAQTLAMTWATLVQNTCARVQARQQARGEIGYDAIISGLYNAIIDPVRGPAVAEQLGQRYSVVMVDEFQDTDRLQWEVFSRAFASGVLLSVGDPKQAIYRFRGADVHAYLSAVAQADPLDLAVNHRSDQQLLAGLEHLFNDATLGDRRIRFVPVTAAPSAPHNALVAEPCVQLRVVPQHPSLLTPKGRTLAMPKVRQLVVNDVVCRIGHILDHDTITTPKVGHPDVTRRVLPGDIAVLVPSHAEAHNVASALRRSGIPAVRTRTGSVLATPAVAQWRLLLTAIARPHQASAARAAAMGWFLATDTTELCGDQADTVLAQLQESIASMADRLNRFGLAAFYHEQKSSGTLVPTILRTADGDRHLTDLDHIAELLSASLHGNSCEPTRVLRVLDEMIATDHDLSDATMRRIESDAKAIQITTIHSAKGLEYPIVLVPFSFKARPISRKPFSFTDPVGLRTLDIAPAVAWDDGLLDPNDATTVQHQESRKKKAQVDTDGDALRLLYVALTRAEHRLEVWWAATLGATASALGRILLDRVGDGPVENNQSFWKLGPRGGLSFVDPPFVGTTPENAIAQIHHLADTSNGAIAVHELPDAIVAPTWSGRSTSATDTLSTASRHGRAALADHAWKRWSFTRLSGLIDARSDATDAEQASDAPLRGGADEPTTDFDSGPAFIPSASEELGSSGDIVAHLADVAAGTTFGTFVHAVLEEVDFTSSELSHDLRELVCSHAQREGLRLDPTPVVDGLVAALRTPLGPLFDQHCLTDFAPHDRLAELTFDMPLGGGLASTHGRLPASSIADILLATLPADDAMRPFATQLAADSASIHIAGWMNGSIDAVVRVPHGNDHRYMVIDYKTNRLHQPGSLRPVDAYHPSLLVHAMNEHRYPLQALLYSVALHRYLRWRLGAAYDPDVHLGGIGYLFVRGMVGPDTPTVGGVAHGVFSWRPPTDAICALDELFATGDPS